MQRSSGRLAPALIVLLTTTFVCLPARATPAATATSPAASSSQVSYVAAKIFAAYGGLEKLKEIKAKSYRSHAKVNVVSGISGAANAFECDILGQDNQLKIETTVLGQQVVLGFDGTNSWTKVGDWVSKSTETTAKRISEELRHGLTLLLKIAEPTSKKRLIGKKEAQGRRCDVLEVVAEDGKPTTFYADEESHLVLRSEYMGTDPEQGVPSLLTIEYFDYRPLAGTKLAFKTVEYSARKKTGETVLDSQEVGVPLDENIFKMPPESEVARVKDSSVTIPFEFIANEIVLKVRLNNQSDHRFILDTGASQTVLDKSIAGTLGPSSVADFSITAGAKAVPLSYTTLRSVTIGDVAVDNVSALITDLSTFAKALGERPGGLIGSNILRRFLVTIDFRDKKVVLSDPKKVVVPPGAIVVTTAPGFGSTALVIPGKLDGKLSLNFLVDTGAAFNNLPQKLAKPLLSGPMLPVGEVFGIDGQKINIGSIKLNSLTIGGLTVRNPVFALAPEGASTGLFNASSMGILGNPIWSRLRLTIDYRNERLILEQSPENAVLDAISTKLQQADRALLRNKNLKEAILSYNAIAAEAAAKQCRSGEALALSRTAACFRQKFERTRDQQWLSPANQHYEKASKLAAASGDDQVEGRVLADWACFYIKAPTGVSDLTSAQALLTRASTLAPTDPGISTTMATLSARTIMAPMAEKFVDQALMMDPSYWDALWLKYELLQKSNNKSGQQLVIAQLKRYYPEVPEVVALTAAPKPSTAPRPRRATAKARAR